MRDWQGLDRETLAALLKTLAEAGVSKCRLSETGALLEVEFWTTVPIDRLLDAKQPAADANESAQDPLTAAALRLSGRAKLNGS